MTNTKKRKHEITDSVEFTKEKLVYEIHKPEMVKDWGGGL